MKNIASRQRRRTVKAALEFFDRELKLPPKQRSEAAKAIRAAKSPKVEAKRIIKRHRYRGMDGMASLEDVRELRDKLVARNLGIWPPQSTIIEKLLCRVREEGMASEEFADVAATIVGMEQALPLSFRKQETRKGLEEDGPDKRDEAA